MIYKLMRYVKWAFWSVYYRTIPYPKSVEQIILRHVRTTSPWYKFSPYVRHDNDWNAWQIYLSDESYYVKPSQSIKVNVHISFDSGKIIGFSIYDESLTIEKTQ